MSARHSSTVDVSCGGAVSGNAASTAARSSSSSGSAATVQPDEFLKSMHVTPVGTHAHVAARAPGSSQRNQVAIHGSAWPSRIVIRWPSRRGERHRRAGRPPIADHVGGLFRIRLAVPARIRLAVPSRIRLAVPDLGSAWPSQRGSNTPSRDTALIAEPPERRLHRAVPVRRRDQQCRRAHFWVLVAPGFDARQNWATCARQK